MTITQGIRWFLTVMMLWGVYEETGPITTLAVLLISIRLEIEP